MAIKLNVTTAKQRPAGAPVGKRTLDCMILGTINNYAPAVVSYGYSALEDPLCRRVDGEEFHTGELQELLHRDLERQASDDDSAIAATASEPEAQEAFAPSNLFQEFASPVQHNLAEPTYISPSDGDMAALANPDPEAPQACFDEAELEASCQNVLRTRRGTIAFVRHSVGTYINPVYNKCGILVRVDLNGITLCRRTSDQTWSIVDTEGDEILPAGIHDVYFDRQGNLITVSNEGNKLTIGVDGTIQNS